VNHKTYEAMDTCPNTILQSFIKYRLHSKDLLKELSYSGSLKICFQFLFTLKFCFKVSSVSRQTSMGICNPMNPGGAFIAETEDLFLARAQGMSAVQANESLVLHQAVSQGFRTTLSSLLQRGHLDVNVVDQDCISALHIAVASVDSLSVDLLIQAGADVDLVDRTGQSSLHLMCTYSSQKMMTVFWFRMSKFLRVSEPTWKLRLDKIQILKSLIIGGANVLLSDHDGWTPFDMSKSQRDSSIRKLIAAKAKDLKTKQKLAVSMALHERLGSTSLIGFLGGDLLRMVCETV